ARSRGQRRVARVARPLGARARAARDAGAGRARTAQAARSRLPARRDGAGRTGRARRAQHGARAAPAPREPGRRGVRGAARGVRATRSRPRRAAPAREQVPAQGARRPGGPYVSQAASAPRPAGLPPRLVVGIDLGTTNSLCAVRAGKGARVLRDRAGEALLPSVVCFHPDGHTIVGRAAKDLRLQFPERTVFSIKRLIGRAGPEIDAEAALLPYPVHQGERGLARVRIGDQDWSPEQVSALILRAVKHQAEQALAQPVSAAVITVPAWFDDAQRQATKDAAALAGLDCLRIVNEPTAASLAYGIDGSRDGTVLVYDLGGGTFDVSILRIEQGVFRVLATVGDTHLGGDDFDRLLGDRILRSIDADAKDPYVLQAVRAAAEGLKIQVSTAQHATRHPDPHGRTGEFTVARAEFEGLIAPLVERTIDCCRRALRDAGLQYEQIDEVVPVGGSTRVPLVR